MPTLLLTAFGPYDDWPENSSWLALQALTSDLPRQPSVTTRLYPVDFGELEKRLSSDLSADFDYALHLGQAPGASSVTLETIGVNVALERGHPPEDAGPLIVGGPVAYRSRLPLGDWARQLRESGIPARLSHHAGTYLCNAALYLSHYLADQMQLKTEVAFVHLPLTLPQAAGASPDLPALPLETSVAALRWVLEHLAEAR